MIPVFVVGDISTARRLLVGRAALVSHVYIGSNFVPESQLHSFANEAAELTIDCGAFTRWNRAKRGQCEECGTAAVEQGEPLCPECATKGEAFSVGTWAAFIEANAHRFARFVSPDVIADADASLRNWTDLLARVPARFHSQLMPVWHEGDPIEHLEAYDPSARLVALGRTKGRQAGSAGRKATRVFYDAAFNAFPDGAFWLLGNGNPETICDYPAKYFDVSTWQRDAAYAQSHGWPWSAVSKDTRMRAYIEAIETITYRPPVPAKQTAFAWVG